MVAGELDEIDLADALGLISFGVLLNRIPPASAWVEEMAEARDAEINESFAANFF